MRGSAYDFCLRVTQRRHRDDLDLVAVGPDADRWLDIAQAFAGPPGTGSGARRAVGRQSSRALSDVLRVGNCSGFYGDRLSAMRELLEGPGGEPRRHHRRLPGRADHADPRQGPAQGPLARLRAHVRHPGRRLPRARAGAGRADRRQRRRAQPRRAGRRSSPRSPTELGLSPQDRLGRRRQPGPARRRARARRRPHRQRLPRRLRHRPGARGRGRHRGHRPGHRRLRRGRPGDLEVRLDARAVRRARRRRRRRPRHRVRHPGDRRQLLRLPRPAARRRSRSASRSPRSPPTAAA